MRNSRNYRQTYSECSFSKYKQGYELFFYLFSLFFYSQRIPSEQPQAIENTILWRTVQGKLYIMLVIWRPVIASHTSKQLPLRPKATVWLWIFKTSKLCTSDGLIPVLILSSGVDDAHQMLESPLPGIGALEVRFNLKGFFPAILISCLLGVLWCVERGKDIRVVPFPKTVTTKSIYLLLGEHNDCSADYASCKNYKLSKLGFSVLVVELLVMLIITLVKRKNSMAELSAVNFWNNISIN